MSYLKSLINLQILIAVLNNIMNNLNQFILVIHLYFITIIAKILTACVFLILYSYFVILITFSMHALFAFFAYLDIILHIPLYMLKLAVIEPLLILTCVGGDSVT